MPGPVLLLATQVCWAQQLTLTPFKPSGIYRLNERVGWTVSSTAGAVLDDTYTYALKRNNSEVVKAGQLDLSTGPATIEITSAEPAMLYLALTPASGASKVVVAGAAVAPEQLRPSVPRPGDFDRFWRSKIRLLGAIPMNPILSVGDSDRPGIDYATITLNHINGGHIHGQLAKPASTGSFPGLVIFQWASPPYPLQKSWVIDRAAEGWLAVNIEPHDVLPDQPTGYYQALPDSLKKYQTIGVDDRDKSYFLRMYLADYRAVEYLASRPDWDHKTLIVMGTSMGGQQSLCAAGLNPRVTGLIVNEPSGADGNGPLHGRAAGYPNWNSNDPKIMHTALYFDTVNCAAHIKVPSLVSIGFVDTTAPPVGIWTAFNQIKAPKEAVPMVDSPHNNLATAQQQLPYTRRSADWLSLLARGYKPLPDGAEPSPHADPTSLLAHDQLLAKARSGHIDLYFLGDSITRRWGTSDGQYREFLENWKQNFFGWNAADFGWGGDTTQNILWRLNRGELDAVDPKVIVLMAGTNNIARAGPLNWFGATGDATAKDVADGIRAIIDVCRRKAPRAEIVLMGITPRNDDMEMMPVITAVNRLIARFDDGHRIRYLNINHRLADTSGRLYAGMTDSDQLHLAARGYQVWADALKPVLTDILGPPAGADLAPAPSSIPLTTHATQ